MSWFDAQGDPTSLAPNAGTAPMTLGSLGQSMNTAPTTGAMAGQGAPTVTTTNAPNVFTAQGTPAGAPTTPIAPQASPYQTNWTSPATQTQGGSSTGQNFGNLSDPSQWMALVQQGPQAVGDWLAKSNPQLAQLFQQQPGLKDYYAQQIIKSPGANPTEQAGSAQYWTNKALQDPGITGGGGGVGGAQGGGSASGIPGLDPGYAFQVGQAQQAIQRSAASKGTLLTGGTLKGLADYIGNDMASTAYQNANTRAFQISSLGENAAVNQGNNNTGYATNAGNTITGGANAQGAAAIAQGNIANSSLSNLGSLGLYGAAVNQNKSSFTPDPSYNYAGGG